MEKKKKPNILLITSDQQHWNTLGAFNEEIETPNLDRLIEEGTTFKRAYCPNPTCTPTRASMITGKYPSQHGAYSLGTKLSEEEHTVGEDFQKNGYRTSLIGKAHFQPLDSTEEFESLEAYPTLQNLDFWKDFDEDFYGFEKVELARNHVDEAHVGQHYALWMEEKGFDNWKDCFRKPTGNSEPQHGTWNIPEEYHYDTWIAERTNKVLEEYVENEENFFHWASFFDPHPPYLVPEPWDEMYDPDDITLPTKVEGEHENNPPHFQKTQEEDPGFSEYIGNNEGEHALHGFHSHLHDPEAMKKNIAVYYGMVSLMDKYIGKILDKLEELGIADNTVVVFTTDHGHLYGQHGLIAKGAFHYEDLLKVPFLVRYPGQIPAGKVNESMQSLVDLAPTLLNLCDIEVPRTMTGKDQSQAWLGKKEEVRDHIICENRHEPDTVHVKTDVDKRYKMTVYYNQEYGELFDLKKDPDEVNNLWDNPEYQELKKDLLLKFMWAEMGKEPLWMPRIANA
ncbi:MAG: sulfatase [Bacillota bacterium]